MPLRIIFLFYVFGSILPAYLNAQEEGKIIRDISYYEGEEAYAKSRCKLDLYLPPGEIKATVVWFHGGGLRGGNKYLPEELRDKGIAIVAPNYRLFPEVKSPTYVEDAAMAIAWTMHNITEYGGKEDEIVISGHSAGGYLASMVGLDTTYLQRYGLSPDSLAAIIPFSGHTITHFTVREERGLSGTKIIADKMAPINHLRRNCPPYIMITGDRDMELLGRYEENAYMWRMMQEINHPYTRIYEIEGYNHGDIVNPAFHILYNEMRELGLVD